jgi:hypothetical protein
MEGIPEVEQMFMWCTDFWIVIVLYFTQKKKITQELFPKDFLYNWKIVSESLSNLCDVAYKKML